MRQSARGAMATRQQSRNLQGFGKMWVSGSKGRVFYSIWREPATEMEEASEWDITVAATWGHSLNAKKVVMKRVFAPTMTVIDEYGKPQGSDALIQFSRISKMFEEGELEKAIRKIMKHPKHSPEKKAALAEDKKKELADNDTAVGRLTYLISTECVYVPLNDKDEPQWDKAALVSQDLSDGRIAEILKWCKDNKTGLEENAEYVEVEYTFGTKGDRKLDGQVSPAQITQEFSLLRQYPTQAAKLLGLLGRLPKDSDIIRGRNSSHHPVKEEDVISALTNYATQASEYLDCLQINDDNIAKLVRNEGVIDQLGIVFENDELTEAFEEGKLKAIEEAKLKGAPNMADITDEEINEGHKQDNGSDSVMDKSEVTEDKKDNLGDLGDLGQS